jgi:hypothetical protein
MPGPWRNGNARSDPNIPEEGVRMHHAKKWEGI